ncbi:MAG: hypothetical protein MUF42_16590 [Cytophagaceae bacterium]|nr:hypothetical protein [Cytophagaceae bacterium]
MAYTYDTEHRNAEGNLHGKHISSDPYEGKVILEHYYDNGLLTQSVHYTYHVNNLSSLTGNYKNGEPFHGYFVTFNSMEIPVIDVLEHGELVGQYTTTMEELFKVDYTGDRSLLEFTKCEIKNGIHWRGIFHSMCRVQEAHMLISEFVEEGKIVRVELWLLAVHYAERIQLAFQDKGYRIFKEAMPDMEDDAMDYRARSIEVTFEDEHSGKLTYCVESELIASYDFRHSSLQDPLLAKQSTILYVRKDNAGAYMQRFNLAINQQLYETSMGYNAPLLSSVFLNLNQQLVPHFTEHTENDYSVLFNHRSVSEPLGMLVLNEHGKPFMGEQIEWLENFFRCTHYENGTVTWVEKSPGLEKLQNLIEKYS